MLIPVAYARAPQSAVIQPATVRLHTSTDAERQQLPQGHRSTAAAIRVDAGDRRVLPIYATEAPH